MKINENLIPSETNDRCSKADGHMLSNDECYDVLRLVDAGDFEVSTWEAGFLDSCLGRSSFTLKQKDVILKLDEKYLRRTNK